jgi:multicomponent Na+:H+ antiporter subunit G
MTWNALLDWTSALILAAGCFFVVVGCLGLIRMPDRYTRMHAASVTDTLGANLVLLGLLLRCDDALVAAKLIVLALLLFFASPTATHALARAAYLHDPSKPTASDGEPPSTR